MVPCGLVARNVLHAMQREKDTEIVDYVWSVMNMAYFHICRGWSWENLRQGPTELDFDEADDETGLYIPSNVFGIDRVRDENSGFEFLPRDKADSEEPDDAGYRYYTYCPSNAAVATGSDLKINGGDDGTDSFTAAGLTTDYTDDYIRFGEELGYYKLTAQTTIDPKYYGPNISGGRYYVRPKETKKLVIMDPSENNLTDRTVDVYYWSAPQPLYQAQSSELIVLPLSLPLELMTLRMMPEAKARRPVAIGEVNEAIDEALKLNADFPRASKPRDQHNATFKFGGRSIYQRRR